MVLLKQFVMNNQFLSLFKIYCRSFVRYNYELLKKKKNMQTTDIKCKPDVLVLGSTDKITPSNCCKCF